MTEGPTTGASESIDRTWQASRFWARAVGVGVFIAPFAAAWTVVWVVGDLFFRPAGNVGIVVWILQSVAVASVVAALVERLVRRLLPLQVLLGMSLTFPDHAPSRFKVALRSGTLRKLKSRLPDISDGGKATVQQAAEHAVELVTMLGRHERLTRGHTERVRAYSDLIAVELGLSEDDRNKLAWAAMLHDIGKLAVPAEILNKDSRPEDSEWAILASHPSQGLELLAPLQGWLGDWLLAASEHHERWDGAGYPSGLAGTEISLAGRIVAVADAYDVITSHRSYKQPMSIEAARSELVACAGNQFDPAIVRALLTASKSDRTTIVRLAGLLELRTVSQALSSVSAVPAAVATSAIALAALLGVPSAALDETATSGPSEVAFLEGAGVELPQAGPASSADSALATTSTSLSSELSGNTSTTTPDQITGATGTNTATTNPVPTGPGTQTATSPTTTPATTALTTTPATTVPTTGSSMPSSTTNITTTTSVPPTSTSATSTTTSVPPTDDCQRFRNGDPDLAGADLAGCDASGLVLSGMNLQSADLTGADLRTTQISSFDLTGAILRDALLDGAQLVSGSAIGMNATRLQAGDVTITNVDLSNSTLMFSDFSRSDLTGVSFANSSLNRSNFAGSQLEGVDFSSASLNDVDFSDIDGGATNFSDSNSQGAVFDRSDISASNFFNAILSRASFVDTGARAVILTDAGIGNADLTRTDLESASGTPSQASNATYNSTVCPDGVTSNTNCWP
jgi:HD-GYP domain-containing protein (c-di-GMP phosphodiesterase class II)/uncharacterized protein YjbI with pentapeptide repeats